VIGHENAATTVLTGTLSPQSGDFSLVTDLVILQSSKLYFLMLVLDLLGSGVILLLALLAATTKAEDQVQGGLLLDVVVGESAAIFELLSCEDETLLIRWDSFLVLDLGFDIVDCVRWLNIKRDGFTCNWIRLGGDDGDER
jgi:hypothetical protein